MLRSTLLLAFLAALFAIPAEAQSIKRCNKEFNATKTEGVAGAAPFAAVNVQGALAHDCNIVTLYALPRKDAKGDPLPTLYFAKSRYSQLKNKPEMRYADSRTCPGVRKALAALSSFRFPPISIPPELPSDVVMVTADGSYYGLWTNRLENSDDKASLTFMEVSVGEWNNDALEALTDKVIDALKPCWQAAEPKP